MEMQYTGEPGRYYADLGIAPVPGGIYDLDADPGDGRWTTPDADDEPVAFQADESETVAAELITDDESDSGPYPDSEE